ncbi:MAG: hypothetical protein JSV37_03045 [Anaerolineaceae bacterium]|nr:MAG: hypothetical protein JSV37_03045 [Anaerolineaceae bacterium]
MPRVDRYISRVRRPVRREGSRRYLLFTLLSFAASVALTRLFLELTGYPQIAGGELHIAHVLWGGLLLFGAALLPLIFANRWVYVVGSLLAGAGVGLFIDEVGKFITQSNDYFHPVAAPIIYAFFLLTVLIYLQVRRPAERDPRDELYLALDQLQEVLDRDLEPSERLALKYRLRKIAENDQHLDLARLAESLMEYLACEELRIAPETPSTLERLMDKLEQLETRWITKRRLKAVLTGGLVALGLLAFWNLVALLMATRDPSRLENVITELVTGGQVASITGMFWFSFRIAVEGLVGLMLVVSAGLFIANKDGSAAALGYFGLLLSLAAVNLVVFYFEQFSTIFPALVQFLLLLGVMYYRRRYLTDSIYLSGEIVERTG